MSPTAEINGVKYRLQLDSEGNPYVLKRYQLNEAMSRWYWGTVWAEWHKGKPTGDRKQAIEAMGFTRDIGGQNNARPSRTHRTIAIHRHCAAMGCNTRTWRVIMSRETDDDDRREAIDQRHMRRHGRAVYLTYDDWKLASPDDDAPQPPYPWCHQPDVCIGKGYCPRDPNCGE